MHVRAVWAKYGNEPGLKAYTHLSDQFALFATQAIPATVHEAPYILDGLLMNEAGRRVREQYADTGGFTDHVFAATALLGYQFIPRIRDLPSKCLHVFDPGTGTHSARGRHSTCAMAPKPMEYEITDGRRCDETLAQRPSRDVKPSEDASLP